MTDTSWCDRFEGLSQLPDDIRQTLIRQSRVIEAPEGTVIFGPGKIPDSMLLLLEGRVRVQQTAESGRDIVLYRIESGQSCVLTTACLLAHEAYSAEAIAETPIRAVAIRHKTFEDIIARSDVFRDFVFAAFSQRITDLFHLIEEVAFGRIDMRLADRLLTLADPDNQVRATHQQLATELGTAREVISRQLQEFHKRGWIEQSRGRISLQDPVRLRQLGATA